MVGSEKGPSVEGVVLVAVESAANGSIDVCLEGMATWDKGWRSRGPFPEVLIGGREAPPIG